MLQGGDWSFANEPSDVYFIKLGFGPANRALAAKFFVAAAAADQVFAGLAQKLALLGQANFAQELFV